jgi:penicillin V acylase-like amidase (Ntn superfamily)
MWELHAVIINKNIPFNKAQKIAKEIINNKNRSFYRETKQSYRFRNISKQKFKKFRSHKVNDNISLIFGLLK